MTTKTGPATDTTGAPTLALGIGGFDRLSLTMAGPPRGSALLLTDVTHVIPGGRDRSESSDSEVVARISAVG